MKFFGITLGSPAPMLAITLVWLCGTPVFAQRNALEKPTIPMKREPAGTNSPRWHTIKVMPKPGLPKTHFYQKLNPVWWLKNSDEPVPPASYLPDDPQRLTKWQFRNPFHNFTFYVIGVADKPITRTGRFPERNSNPKGGWDFEVIRRRLVLLPFVSYERHWSTIYFGWREHGAFGMECRLHRKPTANVPAQAAR